MLDKLVKSKSAIRKVGPVTGLEKDLLNYSKQVSVNRNRKTKYNA